MQLIDNERKLDVVGEVDGLGRVVEQRLARRHCARIVVAIELVPGARL